MKFLQATKWALTGILLLTPAGCHREQTVVVEQQPEPVYAAQQAPEPVIVQEAPPAVIVERCPPRPTPGHVWVAGYWHWNKSRYVWVAGRWTAPPRAHAVWIPPHYDRHGSGYRYVPGHWR